LAFLQILRIAAVMTLVGVAAAIATPKGRLPLAFRGLAKAMGRPIPDATGERVPTWKRLLAFLLVLLATLLAFL